MKNHLLKQDYLFFSRAHIGYNKSETRCIENVTSPRTNLSLHVESDYLRSLFKDKKLSPSTLACIQEELIKRNLQKNSLSGQYTTWQKQGTQVEDRSISNENCTCNVMHTDKTTVSSSVGLTKWDSSSIIKKSSIASENKVSNISVENRGEQQGSLENSGSSSNVPNQKRESLEKKKDEKVSHIII